MDKNQLKEIAKRYFSLVDAPAAVETPNKETFGEVKDINGAFTIKFEGDILEVGKLVEVVTAEGQTMAAPDGTHELEDGRKIVTENSVVTAIHEAMAKEKMEDEVPVGNESMDAPMAMTPEDIHNMIADLVQTNMAKYKEEMANMVKEQMMEVQNQIKTITATTPGIDRTVPSTGAKQAYEAFSKASPNAERMNVALNLLNKNKKTK
jgi:hypothetical protein